MAARIGQRGIDRLHHRRELCGVDAGRGHQQGRQRRAGIANHDRLQNAGLGE